MSPQHIEDDVLDQYASGTLPQELLPDVEEHVLACPDCQSRLIEVDEFVSLFRAAATQPDARPKPFWRRFPVPVLTRVCAAAAVAVLLAFLLVNIREPAIVPATVSLHAFRGPEATSVVPAAKAVRLVFDFTPEGDAGAYEVQLVDLQGTRVSSAALEAHDGHFSILIKNLRAGSYWLRLYRKAGNELWAEYGLRAE